MVVRGTNGQRDLPVKVFVARAPLSRERGRRLSAEREVGASQQREGEAPLSREK